MPNKMSTIWNLEPHTRAKHFILRNYLQAWFPIMGRWDSRLLYVDAYSGPGIYADGEPGSPILALREALNYRQLCTKLGRPQPEIDFLFIEEDKKRFAVLQEQIGQIKLPKSFHVTIENRSFEETEPTILNFIGTSGRKRVPCFAFIDPFGYDLPFAAIERLMTNQKCEVFINFMFEWVNRFIERDGQDAVMKRLFGTEHYKTIDVCGPERHTNIRDFYQKQLETRTAKYVRHFEMRGKTDVTKYYLFHATNHHLGLAKMKEAMWKISPGGDFSFSDATNPNQIVLFGNEPDLLQLETMILRQYSGTCASIDDVEHYVLCYTPFLNKHIRPVLKRLEVNNQLRVPTPRKKGTFPAGTMLEFA